MPQTNFPKGPWIIFINVNPVMMQATSITLASWVLPVLASAAVAYVAPKVSGLLQSGWHAGGQDARGQEPVALNLHCWGC